MRPATARSFRSLYEPKLWTVLRHGYRLDDLRHDALAGLTVAIIALPLAMALAIASGTTPEKGLHTAIVAGFLISFLGGSRVQIGGPTAAFIPVVFNVIAKFGYSGLILCTLLAGLLLIAAGALRLGTLLKYIPKPVITGFTSGIAVSIVSSQIKDLFGLKMGAVPAEFLARWHAYLEHLPDVTPAALALAVFCIVLIAGLRRTLPTWPGFLIAVVLGTLLSTLLALPVETIGSRFGSIPAALPQFALPEIPFARTAEMFPSAFTIAFLAGVESLLSAVVADGMIAGHHRSNAELVAQGVANLGSALFGGLPATGAIARTAANVRSGGRTPVAGMLHAGFLLTFMLLLAPLMRYVPLAALASVLLVVAWNMAEIDSFKHLMRGPVGDRVVLLTFVLTCVFDLTVAIEVGLVLTAFLFMHRMSTLVEMQSAAGIAEESVPPDDVSDETSQRAQLPPGVEAFQISGPLFFAVADRLDDLLNQFPAAPRVFILRFGLVPMIDASGATALRQFVEHCRQRGTEVIFSGLREQPRQVLQQMGLQADASHLRFTQDFAAALQLARLPTHAT